MKILIVDDNLDKISAVTKLFTELKISIQVDSVEDIKSAMLQFKVHQYDLAIIDIYLPLKKGSVIQKNGGGQLLKELYRKSGLHNLPKYVVGLSQMYPIERKDFSNIWNVLQYDTNTTVWSNSLVSFVNHIAQVNHQTNNSIEEKKYMPTLIVEGETDKFYIEKAFELFAPNKLSQINIKSQKNAGANWVAAQLIIWGMMLPKNDSGDIIKSLALLDSDSAGNQAKNEINRILTTPQQSKACKTLQLLGKYSQDILEFYKVKCPIEIEIESLFSLEILDEADSLDYLEIRNPTFIKKPTDWNDFNTTAGKYILDKGIEEESLTLVKKVKLQKKLQFLKLVEEEYNKGNGKKIFKNFEKLIEDIVTTLS